MLRSVCVSTVFVAWSLWPLYFVARPLLHCTSHGVNASDGVNTSARVITVYECSCVAFVGRPLDTPSSPIFATEDCFKQVTTHHAQYFITNLNVLKTFNFCKDSLDPQCLGHTAVYVFLLLCMFVCFIRNIVLLTENTVIRLWVKTLVLRDTK